MADPLSFAAVDDLRLLLQDVGVQASLDPADLNLPGVWLTVETIQAWTVRGTLRLTCALYLIAPNVDPVRALEELTDLYNTVRTVLTPDGPVALQGVILPSAPTEPMPALRVPVYLPGSASALPVSAHVLEAT